VVYTASPQDYNFELNVSGFDNGVYFIQVLTSSGFKTERLQISK